MTTGRERQYERAKALKSHRAALYANEPKAGPPSRQVIRKMARARAHDIAAPSYSWRLHFATEWAILRDKLRPVPANA